MQKTRVLIVEERKNPSTDFFIRPQFPTEIYDVEFYSLSQQPDNLDLDDAIVVLVRYLSPLWKSIIESHRHHLQEFIYFMDDDLFDWRAYRNQSLRYQFKLYRLATRYQRWFIENIDELWVSTSFLEDKYSSFNAIRIAAQPIAYLSKSIRVFYHGSASHQAEIDWLYPVMQAVLQHQPNVVFEIIGDAAVYKRFKKLPRVQVVHPMDWDGYQAFIKQPGRNIGLVPLVDNPFNHARSHTKVFDIQAAGAIGIYAQGSECACYIQNQYGNDSSEGVILPMEPGLWIEKIIELSESL